MEPGVVTRSPGTFAAGQASNKLVVFTICFTICFETTTGKKLRKGDQTMTNSVLHSSSEVDRNSCIFFSWSVSFVITGERFPCIRLWTSSHGRAWASCVNLRGDCVQNLVPFAAFPDDFVACGASLLKFEISITVFHLWKRLRKLFRFVSYCRALHLCLCRDFCPGKRDTYLGRCRGIGCKL
jgi:hypothetical protein